MSSFNALSVPSYYSLANGIYKLKKDYTSTDRYWTSAVFLDTSYLRYPRHQTIQILPDYWAEDILHVAQYVDYLGIPKFDNKLVGYSDVEIQKIKRSYDWMKAYVPPEQIKKQRYNFGKFFQAHDKRRGTNFINTFPELADFYNDCLELKL